jgi:DNA-binding response OmpR family regulator
MPRVLVVEDSRTQALAVKSLLQRARFTVDLAENGREALDAIRAVGPDVVVTDLQMPEMNGLDLVEAVRRDHLFLPVIVMTQYGSEAVAVEALEKGAASYVPKSALDRDLLRTVDEVLSAAASLRRRAVLRECIQATSSRFELPNDEQLISPLTERLEQDLAEMGLVDDLGIVRIAVALREAILNAIHHGNLEVSSQLRLESCSANLRRRESYAVAGRLRRARPGPRIRSTTIARSL